MAESAGLEANIQPTNCVTGASPSCVSTISRNAALSGVSSGGRLSQALAVISRLPKVTVLPTGTSSGETHVANAAKEVIVCAGAVGSPHLLLLSGIGPRAVLEHFGIAPRVDLPGVGRNLQDRYEICVLNRMRFAHWESLAGARFARDDPLYRAWAAGRDSLYGTCGAGLGVIKRSTPERPLPASVAKRRIIEALRDIALEELELARVIAPVLAEFTESTAKGEWQASVQALTALRARHGELAA